MTDYLDYLARDEGCAALLQKAMRIRKLNAKLHAEMPGLPARVANLKADRIIIVADHGAAAARLRQCLVRLQTLFATLAPDCRTIQIKVQPQSPVIPPPARAGARPLTGNSRAALSSLAHSLGEAEPLAQAIERLQQRAPLA